MGCRVIGRGLLLLGWLALGGCASTGNRDATQEPALRSVLMQVYEAVARGDEAEYRRLVQLPAGDAYSDALTTTMFESIRLHQAVERHLGRRDDATRLSSPKSSDPGPDAAVGKPQASSQPSSRPTSRPASQPSLAAVDYRVNARAMTQAIAGWTFTVRGDHATIDQLEGRPGAPVLRRVNGRWVLAPTEWDTRRDTATYRLAVAHERALAAALARARESVESNSARSVEEVNAVLRDLLTELNTATTSPIEKGVITR